MPLRLLPGLASRSNAGSPAADELSTAVTATSSRGASPDQLLDITLCHVRYGLVPALRGVSLAVRQGEMIALLGANGAGKTTTLRAISGLIHPHSGEIRFKGERIDQLSPPGVVRRGIAHLPEGRDLFPQLTVKENLRYGYWPQRRDRAGYRPQLEEVFDFFPRLRERANQRAGTLSGGEQQMLGVGMALMSRPQLLIVDELSLGLAPRVVGQLFEILTMVNGRGTSILLVEQFVPLALAHTNRAYVLAKGVVVVAQASAELKDDPKLVASYLGGAIPDPTASVAGNGH
jgi:branched-chain amino acid transport system ATP-binding protein